MSQAASMIENCTGNIQALWKYKSEMSRQHQCTNIHARHAGLTEQTKHVNKLSLDKS